MFIVHNRSSLKKPITYKVDFVHCFVIHFGLVAIFNHLFDRKMINIFCRRSSTTCARLIFYYRYPAICDLCALVVMQNNTKSSIFLGDNYYRARGCGSSVLAADMR